MKKFYRLRSSCFILNLLTLLEWKNAVKLKEFSEILEQVHTRLNVNYPSYKAQFTQTEIFTSMHKGYLSIKFYENVSSTSRGILCGQTDGQSHMKMLIVDFLNFLTVQRVKVY